MLVFSTVLVGIHEQMSEWNSFLMVKLIRILVFSLSSHIYFQQYMYVLNLLLQMLKTKDRVIMNFCYFGWIWKWCFHLIKCS